MSSQPIHNQKTSEIIFIESKQIRETNTVLKPDGWFIYLSVQNMLHQNVEIDERTVQGIGISFGFNQKWWVDKKSTVI